MPAIMGFPVGFTAQEIDVQSFPVPGADAIHLQMRADIAPLLLGLAAEYNRTVELLIPSQCGGWNPRHIAGSTHWSRHACGIAIDLNSGRHPSGQPNMTAEQSRTCRALAAKYGCRWGGDYVHAAVDQMHFEVNLPFGQAQALAKRPPGPGSLDPNTGSPIISAGSPLHPARADVTTFSITITGPGRTAEVVAALTGSKLIRTLEGAQSVVLTVTDRKRVLLYGLAKELAGATLVLDQVVFELAGVKKRGDVLDLTFEDQVAAVLRRQKGLKISTSDLVTRTDFARGLLADPPTAGNNFADARWVEFRGEPTLPYPNDAGLYIDPKASLSRGTQDQPNTESTWDCLGRIARDINWRRFSDGTTLFFGSDAWLRSLRVPILMSELTAGGLPVKGVTSIDFSVDLGLEVTDATVALNFTRQALPIGGPVDLERAGPGDGAYIIKDTTRSLHSPEGTMTLTRPIAAVLAVLPVYDVGGGGVFTAIGLTSGAQQFTDDEVARFAYDAGFGKGVKHTGGNNISLPAGREGDLITAVAICLAESSGNNSAEHLNFTDVDKVTGKPGPYYGSTDRGLWQINSHAWPEYDPRKLVTDGQYNADAAYKIFTTMHGFKPWASYNSHGGTPPRYRSGDFLARAVKAAKSVGVSGWN